MKPALRVQVTYRPSLTGEGLVVQLHNELGSRLVLGLEVQPGGVGPIRRMTESLGPHAVGEVGWLHEHAFHSGDRVRIRHERRRSRSLMVP